jgi:HK97 family phage portal protein
MMAWYSPITQIFKGLYKKEDKPKQLEHGADWDSPYGTRNTYSPEKALEAYASHGYTHAAVTRASQDLAALPIKVIKKNGADSEILDNHPLYDLFEEPSTQCDGFLLREQLSIDLILSGNCFVILLGPDIPSSIMRLHPQEVEIITDRTGITGYKYTSGGNVTIFPPDRIIHGRNASYAKGPQQNLGLGIVQPLSAEIDADINSMFLASTASAKGRPDIILSPKDETDIWGAERRRTILSQYQGLARDGGCMVLSGLVDITPLNLSPREMEYEKSRIFARQSISAVAGVPPSVLGLPSANYATLIQQNRIYWSGIQKRGKKFEILFSKIAKRFDPSLSIIFDYSGIEALQEVRKSQMERVQMHVNMGMLPSDAYKYEGLADAPISDDSIPIEDSEILEEEIEVDRLEETEDMEDEQNYFFFPEVKKKAMNQNQ